MTQKPDPPERAMDLSSVMRDVSALDDTLDGTAASLAGAVWLSGEIQRVMQIATAGEDPEAAPRLRQMSAVLAANSRTLLRPGEAERAFRQLVQYTITAAQSLADRLEDAEPDEETSS